MGLDKVMLAVRPGSGVGSEGSVEETKDALYGGPNPHSHRPSGGSRRVHGTRGGSQIYNGIYFIQHKSEYLNGLCCKEGQSHSALAYL